MSCTSLWSSLGSGVCTIVHCTTHMIIYIFTVRSFSTNRSVSTHPPPPTLRPPALYLENRSSLSHFSFCMPCTGHSPPPPPHDALLVKSTDPSTQTAFFYLKETDILPFPTHAHCLSWGYSKTLKGILSSGMDLAESDINRWVFLKGWGAGVFRKIYPLPILETETLKSFPSASMFNDCQFGNNWDVGQKIHCAEGITEESAKLLFSPLPIGKQRRKTHRSLLPSQCQWDTLFAQFPKVQSIRCVTSYWSMKNYNYKHKKFTAPLGSRFQNSLPI